MTFSEAIKVLDGAFLNIEGHRRRMDRTARYFFGRTFPWSPPLPPRSGLWKCRVVYGSSGIESVEFAPYAFRPIRTAALVRDDGIEYAFKSTDRRRLEELRAASGADDIVIVRNGLVTDASFANVVVEDEDGALYTPAEALLRGTKREQLLATGRIRERDIRPEELLAASKIYLINAMIDLEDDQRLRF